MNAKDAYQKLFPDAQIDTDNYGQVIIYTNMVERGRDEHNQPVELVPRFECAAEHKPHH